MLEVAVDVLGFAPGDRCDGRVQRRGTCCHRRSPEDHAHPLRVVLRTGSGGTGGFPHRVLRFGRPRPRSRGASGCWCTPPQAVLAWLRCSLAKHWGLDVFATAGPRKWDTLRSMGFDEINRELAHARIPAEVFRGNRRGRYGRRTRLPERRIRRCVAATFAARRAIHRDGQDGHPRSRRGGGAASGCSLSILRPSAKRSRPCAERYLASW